MPQPKSGEIGDGDGYPKKSHYEEVLANLSEIEDCEECKKIMKNLLDQTCPECGGPSYDEESKLCHLGLDLVGLFPSMTEMTTGEIVRRRAEKSTLQMPSFDTKQGGRYIIMNQHLTGPLGKLRRVLPRRRKTQGRMPGMTNPDLNKREGNIDAQWVFPEAKPREAERKEIIGRCAQIAVRTLFMNFCYTF